MYLFLYLWLCWVFVSVRGLSPVAESGGHSSSRCAGLSLSRPLLLRSTSSRRAGSVVVAHGPSRSAACGIFPDQGSNLCPLHWQADSQPLRHQGSPGGLSCCRTRAPGAQTPTVAARRLSSCGLRAPEHRLSSCGARAQLLRGMWDPPGPGLEPVSPALAGGLPTTAPPGKSPRHVS